MPRKLTEADLASVATLPPASTRAQVLWMRVVPTAQAARLYRYLMHEVAGIRDLVLNPVDAAAGDQMLAASDALEAEGVSLWLGRQAKDSLEGLREELHLVTGQHTSGVEAVLWVCEGNLKGARGRLRGAGVALLRGRVR